MKAAVVDTNVLVVANQHSSHASDACVKAAMDALRGARRGLVVVDNQFRIFKEYLRYCSPTNSGLGDLFVAWILDNQANPNVCETVPLTQKNGSEHDFKEFPSDPALADFDRSDRKFVAVALASKNQPEVLNATDTDWWHFRKPLQANGVTIRFLCPDEMPV